MTNKRFTGLVLSMLFLAIIPLLYIGTADAQTNGITPDEYTYNIMDAEATITGHISFNVVETQLNIPDEVEGVPVRHIGAFAFGSPDLLSVSIPVGVTRHNAAGRPGP